MYIRNPRQLTLQYELKIFDEAIKAPLVIFSFFFKPTFEKLSRTKYKL